MGCIALAGFTHAHAVDSRTAILGRAVSVNDDALRQRLQESLGSIGIDLG
jgi:hypothetical protein